MVFGGVDVSRARARAECESVVRCVPSYALVVINLTHLGYRIINLIAAEL